MPNESRSRRSNLINRVPTDAFLDVSPAEQVSIVLELPLSARLPWVRLLPLDDAADLVQAAPDREREGLLGLLDDEARREVRGLMGRRNCLDRTASTMSSSRSQCRSVHGCGAVGDARRFRTALHPSLFQVGSCQCIGAVCRHTRGRDGLDYLFHCCGRCSKRNVVVICGVH